MLPIADLPLSTESPIVVPGPTAGSLVVAITIAAPVDAGTATLTVVQGDITVGPLAATVLANADGTSTLSITFMPPDGLAGPDAVTAHYSVGGAAQPALTVSGEVDAGGAVPSFTPWTDIFTLVRQLLQMKATRLANPVILAEFELMVLFTLARFNDPPLYPCLASYAGLTGTDQQFFDTYAAHVTAIQLYPLKYAGTSGLVDQVKVGSFQFKYTASGDDPRKAWADKAVLSLGYVSCIRAARLAAARSWNPNKVDGPSKATDRSGVTQGLLNSVLNVFQDRQDNPLV